MEPDFESVNVVVENQIALVDADQAIQFSIRGDFVKAALVACAYTGAGILKQAIDVYHGPDGNGYVLRFIYELDGRRWCRCEGRGPQAFRTHSWTQLMFP